MPQPARPVPADIDTKASVASGEGFRHGRDTGGGDDAAMRKSILDPNFRYRPSHETDIRKTFERVREELARAKQQRAVPPTVSRLLRNAKL